MSREFGWTGPEVRLCKTSEDLEAETVATVRLSDDSPAQAWCDSREIMAKWEAVGVVGRADRGRVFPRDGQAFLDELPFAYRSAYLWAEPTG